MSTTTEHGTNAFAEVDRDNRRNLCLGCPDLSDLFDVALYSLLQVVLLLASSSVRYASGRRQASECIQSVHDVCLMHVISIGSGESLDSVGFDVRTSGMKREAADAHVEDFPLHEQSGLVS
jgi:hypothetical protein